MSYLTGTAALMAGDLKGRVRHICHIASTSPTVIRIMQPVNATKLDGA